MIFNASTMAGNTIIPPNDVGKEFEFFPLQCSNTKCVGSTWSDTSRKFVSRINKHDGQECPLCNRKLCPQMPDQVIEFLVDNFANLQN